MRSCNFGEVIKDKFCRGGGAANAPTGPVTERRTTAPRTGAFRPQSIRLHFALGRAQNEYQEDAGGATIRSAMKKELKEIRCCHCCKLLAKGEALELEIKCPRCGAYTILRAARPKHELRDSLNEGKDADCREPV